MLETQVSFVNETPGPVKHSTLFFENKGLKNNFSSFLKKELGPLLKKLES
jgi:hypothetical protein